MPEEATAIDYMMEAASGPHFSGLRLEGLRSSSPSCTSSPSAAAFAAATSLSAALFDSAAKQPFVIGKGVVVISSASWLVFFSFEPGAILRTGRFVCVGCDFLGLGRLVASFWFDCGDNLARFVNVKFEVCLVRNLGKESRC